MSRDRTSRTAHEQQFTLLLNSIVNRMEPYNMNPTAHTKALISDCEELLKTIKAIAFCFGPTPAVPVIMDSGPALSFKVDISVNGHDVSATSAVMQQQPELSRQQIANRRYLPQKMTIDPQYMHEAPVDETKANKVKMLSLNPPTQPKTIRDKIREKKKEEEKLEKLAKKKKVDSISTGEASETEGKDGKKKSKKDKKKKKKSGDDDDEKGEDSDEGGKRSRGLDGDDTDDNSEGSEGYYDEMNPEDVAFVVNDEVSGDEFSSRRAVDMALDSRDDERRERKREERRQRKKEERKKRKREEEAKKSDGGSDAEDESDKKKKKKKAEDGSEKEEDKESADDEQQASDDDSNEDKAAEAARLKKADSEDLDRELLDLVGGGGRGDGKESGDESANESEEDAESEGSEEETESVSEKGKGKKGTKKTPPSGSKAVKKIKAAPSLGEFKSLSRDTQISNIAYYVCTKIFYNIFKKFIVAPTAVLNSKMLDAACFLSPIETNALKSFAEILIDKGYTQGIKSARSNIETIIKKVFGLDQKDAKDAKKFFPRFAAAIDGAESYKELDPSDIPKCLFFLENPVLFMATQKSSIERGRNYAASEKFLKENNEAYGWWTKVQTLKEEGLSIMDFDVNCPLGNQLNKLFSFPKEIEHEVSLYYTIRTEIKSLPHRLVTRPDGNNVDFEGRRAQTITNTKYKGTLAQATKLEVIRRYNALTGTSYETFHVPTAPQIPKKPSENQFPDSLDFSESLKGVFCVKPAEETPEEKKPEKKPEKKSEKKEEKKEEEKPVKVEKKEEEPAPSSSKRKVPEQSETSEKSKEKPLKRLKKKASSDDETEAEGDRRRKEADAAEVQAAIDSRKKLHEENEKQKKEFKEKKALEAEVEKARLQKEEEEKSREKETEETGDEEDEPEPIPAKETKAERMARERREKVRLEKLAKEKAAKELDEQIAKNEEALVKADQEAERMKKGLKVKPSSSNLVPVPVSPDRASMDPVSDSDEEMNAADLLSQDEGENSMAEDKEDEKFRKTVRAEQKEAKKPAPAQVITPATEPNQKTKGVNLLKGLIYGESKSKLGANKLVSLNGDGPKSNKTEYVNPKNTSPIKSPMRTASFITGDLGDDHGQAIKFDDDDD